MVTSLTRLSVKDAMTAEINSLEQDGWVIESFKRVDNSLNVSMCHGSKRMLIAAYFYIKLIVFCKDGNVIKLIRTNK